MNERKAAYSTDIIFGGVIAVFVVVLFLFGIIIIQNYWSGRKICQSIVSIEQMEYNEKFLEEAKKTKGLLSIDPVIAIPIKLKTEGYTMDTTLLCIDWSKLQKGLIRSSEVPIGNTLVLLLGEDSLARMVDCNGYAITERKKQEYINQFMNMEWQYSLNIGDMEEDERIAGNGKSEWKNCYIAGILSYPEEYVYMSDGQMEVLKELESKQPITKILLTVQGERNYENALKCFTKQISITDSDL